MRLAGVKAERRGWSGLTSNPGLEIASTATGFAATPVADTFAAKRARRLMIMEAFILMLVM
jgi:hypothetical protein